jgi:hypothetical protein
MMASSSPSASQPPPQPTTTAHSPESSSELMQGLPGAIKSSPQSSAAAHPNSPILSPPESAENDPASHRSRPTSPPNHLSSSIFAPANTLNTTTDPGLLLQVFPDREIQTDYNRNWWSHGSIEIVRHGHRDDWLTQYEAGSLPGITSFPVEIQAWMRLFYRNHCMKDSTDQQTADKIAENITKAKWDGAEFWSAVDKKLIRHYLTCYGFAEEDGQHLAMEVERSLQTPRIFLYRVLFAPCEGLLARGWLVTALTACQGIASIAPFIPDCWWKALLVLLPLISLVLYLVVRLLHFFYLYRISREGELGGEA